MAWILDEILEPLTHRSLHIQTSTHEHPLINQLRMIGLILCMLVVVLLLNRLCSKPKDFPPGPPRLPFVGSLPFMMNEWKLPCFFHGCLRAADKYGEVCGFYFGKDPAVAIADIEILKKVLKREDVLSRPPFQPLTSSRLGYSSSNELVGGGVPGLAFSNGEFWRETRRFVVSSLKKFGFGKSSMQSIFLHDAKALCQTYEKHGGQAFNMNHTMQVAILNSVWTLVVGDRFRLDDPRINELVVLLDQGLNFVSPVLASLPHPSLAKLPLLSEMSGYRFSRDTFQSLVEIIWPMVREHSMSFSTEQEDGDLMDCMIRQMRNTQDKQSTWHPKWAEATMVNTCAEILIPGMEATASTLIWGFLYILHHPHTQQRAREEVDKVVGMERLPTLEDASNMPYTEAIMHEFHRKTGFTPFGLPHYTTSDISIELESSKKSYRIPKGTTILPNLYRIMNDPHYFKDPEVFKPERFLDESGRFLPDDRVVPFGIGKRFCPGGSVAEKQMFLTFVYMIQHFVVEADPNHVLPKYDGMNNYSNGITRPPPDYFVRLVQRKKLA